MTTPPRNPSPSRRRPGRPAAGAGRHPGPLATAAPAGFATPPTWRDPWALASALAVIPILVHSGRALLGEPVADDYHFLHHALLEPHRSFFDGGGAVIYWRPLSRQVYYGLFGPLMLTHPRIVALIHAGLLALTALLLYRALRPRWSGPSAALAATFPLFSEGTRTLLLWPAAFQDLGALLFSSLALHEAAHRRMISALVALLAALLCKEIALVAAVLLPWMPNGTPGSPSGRARFALATAAVVAAWGAVYLLVRRAAGVLFQRHLEEGRLPLPQRLLWAFGHGGGDALNLGAGPPALALIAAGAAVALVIVALLRGVRAGGARAPRPAWIAWGLAWFAIATATLSETYPQWGGFRSTVGLAGLGIAVAAALPGLGTGGVVLLAALRLTTFFLTPGPPVAITQAPPSEGEGLDFNSLARLQRYAADVRQLVTARHPELPPGSAIGRHHRPLMAEHAFAAGRAAQVWYRDTTLRWVEWKEIVANPTRQLAVVLEYEPYQERQVALIDGEAMVEYLEAVRIMSEARFGEALLHLDRADSLQRDRGAAVFLGGVEGKRSLCRLGLDDPAAARAEAIRSLALWPDAADARYVLAVLAATSKDYMGALAQLDTVLAKFPFDESAVILRDSLRIEAERAAAR